jgi:hypothetical protein
MATNKSFSGTFTTWDQTNCASYSGELSKWREQSLLAHLRSAPHFLRISLINLRIIDPNGRENRKKSCISRRVYNAPGSGYIHHCDTHHKLGRWGLVTFGAIEGYSHKVIALKRNIDNKAVTLLRAYCSSPGIQENGFPEFMRGDYGGENLAIARCLNSAHQEVGRLKLISWFRSIGKQMAPPMRNIQIDSVRALRIGHIYVR